MNGLRVGQGMCAVIAVSLVLATAGLLWLALLPLVAWLATVVVP